MFTLHLGVASHAGKIHAICKLEGEAEVATCHEQRLIPVIVLMACQVRCAVIEGANMCPLHGYGIGTMRLHVHGALDSDFESVCRALAMT